MKQKSSAVAPAVSLAGEKRAGLNMEYNHDLDVSEGFLCAYPGIRAALKDARLLEAFQFYDRQARAHKRSFQLLGFSSLILGLIPLLVASLRMIAGESAFARMSQISILAEFCGVASVCLVLWIRRKQHRVLWCQAVFCRERLRQWHFQKFLDGKLIHLLVNEPAAYERELGRRWGELQQNLLDGPGMMGEFMSAGSHRNDFFHEAVAYDGETIAKPVFDALRTLRFQHQLRFSRVKIEPEGERTGMALKQRTTLSETVASATLAGAILVTALTFFASSAHILFHGTAFPWDPLTLTRDLSGAALFLGLLSAASRAYRAGYTLPDEAESCEEYCDHVRELTAVFENVSSDREKLHAMKHLEEESAAELRRFLRMKARATFVF